MMKNFAVVLLILLLSGCGIKSDQSLIERSEGVAVFPAEVILFSPGALVNPLLHIVRNGAVYSIENYEEIDGEFSELVLAPVRGYSGYFAVQLSAGNGDIQQVLVRISGRSVEMQNIDLTKMMEERGVRGLSERDGSVFVSSRAALNALYKAAIEFNTNDATVYRVYDTSNDQQIMELIALRKELERENQEAGTTSQSSEPFNPDLWKNDWQSLTSKVRNMIDALPPVDGQIDIARDVEGHMLKLPWYENAFLVRLNSGWTPRNLVFYYLYDGGDKLVRLDGTSSEVHAFNSKNPLILNDETIKPYLWFFTFFVRGEEGPFLMVQSNADTFLPDADGANYDANTLNSLNRGPRPAACQASADPYVYRCSAVVMYSNAMFEAQFGIQSSGMIVMIDDISIAADLAVKVYAPISIGEVNEGVTVRSNNTSSLSGLSGVPSAQRSALESVASNDVITLDRTNLPFFAGLGAVLSNRCQLPRNSSQRAELLTFSMSASTSIIFGTDYSNPNLGEAMRSMAANSTLFSAGSEIASQLPCGSSLAENIADGILTSLRASGQRGSDGRSRFVRSCTPRFNETTCNCLAQQGRSVIPDIHSKNYSPMVIEEIIERNPLLGLQIAFLCGISNY